MCNGMCMGMYHHRRKSNWTGMAFTQTVIMNDKGWSCSHTRVTCHFHASMLYTMYSAKLYRSLLLISVFELFSVVVAVWQTLPCSICWAMCSFPGVAWSTSQMVSSPSGDCETVKSALMIRVFRPWFCWYDSTSFFFDSLMIDLSTSFGRTLLASMCCHRRL